MSGTGNRLLDALSPDSRNMMLSGCSLHKVPVGTALYQPEELVPFVYWLTSGIASVAITTAEGLSAELVLIGAEGLTGGIQLLGPASIPASCFIQLEATAYRMRFSCLEDLFHSSEEIRTRVLEFLQHGALTISQIAGCNGLHSAESRLARWLLMAQDRTQSADLNFTQEFLGEMLGVQRTTVSGVARSLDRSRLIRYSRGRLTIVDRPGLEAAACSCYPIVSGLSRQLYSKAFRSWNK